MPINGLLITFQRAAPPPPASAQEETVHESGNRVVIHCARKAFVLKTFRLSIFVRALKQRLSSFWPTMLNVNILF